MTIITVKHDQGPVMTAVVVERAGLDGGPLVYLPLEMATQETLVSLDRLGGPILAQLPDTPNHRA